jgi:hypothetical protein
MYKPITRGDVAPFENYLMLDDGRERLAWSIGEEEPLDLQLLLKANSLMGVKLERSYTGMIVCIKLDGTVPDSPICWTSSQFSWIED